MIYYYQRWCTYSHMHDRARGRQGDRQTRVGYPVTGAYLYSKMENKYKRSNSIPTYYYYLLY